MSNITYEYIYMLSETEDIKRVMTFKNSKIEEKYLQASDPQSMSLNVKFLNLQN